MGIFKSTLLILLTIAAWVCILLADIWFGWTRTPLAAPGDTPGFMAAAREMIADSTVGNIAMAVMEDGRISDEHFYSVGKPVDGETLFQVASVSKWITAWGVLALAENGRIDLDEPVSSYLTRWSLPPTEFDNDGVTVRRLLCHSAGLTDGFGYLGFETEDEVQSLEDSLTLTADGAKRNIGVHVGAPPGERFMYSGGGFTLLQLLIEEVTGQSFNDYMRGSILRPVGMTASTFVIDDNRAPYLADFYDSKGNIAIHYRYTALAAASLYTSVDDLSRFLQAYLGIEGRPPGLNVLSVGLLNEMQQPHAWWIAGKPIWGLGVALAADNNRGGFVIGHDGANRPAINTAVRIDPATGNGIIVLSSGADGLATFIAEEWTYWQTGNQGRVSMMVGILYHVPAFLIGAVVIIIVGVVFGVFRAA